MSCAALDWSRAGRTGASEAAYPSVNALLSGVMQIERDKGLETLVPALQALGHEVKPQGMDSGLNGILVRENGYDGAADLRREGAVGGD